MAQQSQQLQDTFDVIGLGFGPANLAIAAAITEKWSVNQNGQELPVRNALFIEKHPDFLWHPGMLIPGSQMQISCLKDLATLRNPSSSYTFLNYLHSQNRLINFINRGSTIPSRREYADYLTWAATEVQKKGVNVAFSEEVVSVSKIDDDQDSPYVIEVISRRLATGEIVKRRTKNIIISGGGAPNYPTILAPLAPAAVSNNAPRAPLFHTCNYITSVVPYLQTLSKRNAPLKLAVVGAGQSAAEVTLDLQRRLDGVPSANGQPHEVHMIIRKGCLKPSDDSPFVNEIFDPASTDKVYNLPSTRLRDAVRAEYVNTNYSVVNPRTLDAVYEAIYDQKLDDDIVARAGQKPGAVLPPRLVLRTYQTIVKATSNRGSTDDADTNTAITLTTQDSISREITEMTYDAVVCGTGYDRSSWARLLRASNLAKVYGLTTADSTDVDDAPIRLIPESGESHDEQIRFNFLTRGTSSSSPSSGPASIAGIDSVPALSRSESVSSNSTPPTSPTLSASAAPPLTARISRRYRLLAASEQDGAESWKGKIYLQGCSEATHGLSDTLLSVLGVKAGEVVDDIWESVLGVGAETEHGHGAVVVASV